MSKTADCKISQIGYGHFGSFMAPHLSSRLVYDHNPRKKTKGLPPGARWASLDEVAECDVVVLAIPALPVRGFIKILKRIAPKLRPGTLVVDVCSVKQIPIELMKKYLPDHVEIVGSHPLFGPKSAAKGLMRKKNKFKVVLCPVRVSDERFLKIKLVLRKLGLLVIEIDPKEHDQEMAMVLAVTHFVGRALGQAGIRRSRLSTKSYRGLVGSKEIAVSDSLALFWNLMMGYPEAIDWVDRVVAAVGDWGNRVKKRLGRKSGHFPGLAGHIDSISLEETTAMPLAENKPPVDTGKRAQ